MSKAARMSFDNFKNAVYDRLESEYKVASIDDLGGWLTVKFENGHIYHSKRDFLRIIYRTYYSDDKQFDKTYKYLSESINKDLEKGIRKI